MLLREQCPGFPANDYTKTTRENYVGQGQALPLREKRQVSY